MTLFTTAYFPSISYMARFLKEDAPVVEIWETYTTSRPTATAAA